MHLIPHQQCFKAHLPDTASEGICCNLSIMGKAWLWWFPSARDTLFEEGFQSSLAKGIEQVIALHKAASVIKHHHSLTSPSRQMVFFAGALLPGMWEGRVNVCSDTVKISVWMLAVMHFTVTNFNRDQSSHTYAQKPRMFFMNPSCLHGKHRKPSESHNRLATIYEAISTKWAWTPFERSLAWTPVGCHLCHFAANWAKVISNPCVLVTMLDCCGV